MLLNLRFLFDHRGCNARAGGIYGAVCLRYKYINKCVQGCFYLLLQNDIWDFSCLCQRLVTEWIVCREWEGHDLLNERTLFPPKQWKWRTPSTPGLSGAGCVFSWSCSLLGITDNASQVATIVVGGGKTAAFDSVSGTFRRTNSIFFFSVMFRRESVKKLYVWNICNGCSWS